MTDPEIGCESDTRAQTYESGLTVPGESGHFTFVLEDAEPAPPAKGLNRWTIEVLGSDSLNELAAVPFMPEHNHGPARAPTVEPMGQRFTIDGIDFFMPGLWRVTITAKSSDANDTAEFFFCVPG